ncbi:MAG TPA: PadR family transcriptional regulator [Gaiellaceae bacterium]|nr:PadR family transcriptional regulator [Gaiellaceae bacterium]
MSSLSPTARVILGLLAWQPRTGYEIKQVTDQSTRFFWGASYGQIYPELRRLEAAGLVESREEPRGRVPRRIYSLTEAGQEALDAWLEEGEESYEVRDEGLLKLFFSDLMSAEQRLDLIRRRQAWCQESAALFRRIDDELGELDETSGSVLRYGIELMEWDAAWWRDLERRLS